MPVFHSPYPIHLGWLKIFVATRTKETKKTSAAQPLKPLNELFFFSQSVFEAVQCSVLSIDDSDGDFQNSCQDLVVAVVPIEKAR
mmetsp:Transcript_28455/g.69237  ORF Transcript_28455/g.69237 Transcript_28455/m.69237 type:complete len:85 (-) Transcript_28455:377-631(-)